ncbi:MAG: esterase family protein [Kordiimonadaceae bacterium]|nr:esterase family protein [Kordiimonadaceae bacterium]MBO6568269.1 esterase family protein [Kordiimonadaceae bacterium]MBO6964001.1 esterase family protein [Kordiimonadaceae bacterium]
MQQPLCMIALLIGWCAGLFSGAAALDGELSHNQRISSSHLGYDLQYRVYTPEGVENLANLPTLYLTDGQGYISSGQMPRVLDKEIKAGRVRPMVAVFVDPRDPDNLRNNRRNYQFFCNQDYLKFFVTELVPRISDDYPVSYSKQDRAVMGLSFGGLNAACFGLMAPSVFGAIGMQSPAIHPVPILRELYEKEDTRDIRIFFSLGKIRDNTEVGRDLKRILEMKGYDMHYVEVNASHTWRNWRPLLDDALQYFFPAQAAQAR